MEQISNESENINKKAILNESVNVNNNSIYSENINPIYNESMNTIYNESPNINNKALHAQIQQAWIDTYYDTKNSKFTKDSFMKRLYHYGLTLLFVGIVISVILMILN